MNRQRAIAVVLVGVVALAVVAWWRSPQPKLETPCPDGGLLTLDAEGVARCGEGRELPAGQAMTAGQRFDCNTARAEELALVPGIGRSLADEIVARRGDGGFKTWDELDAIPGVGAARLNALQAVCDIRLVDAGVW